MATTDTVLKQFILNVGTTSQIEAAIQGGTITSDMLSITTDGPTYITTNDVTSTYSSTGTAPVNGTAVASAVSGVLPSQSGNSGKFLTTNGSAVSWAAVDALPSQTSQSGKFLTTNGTTASWASLPTVDQTYNASSTNAQSGVAVAGALATVLPSQTSQSGKFLTTNGTAASWASIPTEIPSQSGNSGKFLTTNGTAVSWANAPEEIPSQTGNNGKYLTTNGTTASWATVLSTITYTPATETLEFA